MALRITPIGELYLGELFGGVTHPLTQLGLEAPFVGGGFAGSGGSVGEGAGVVDDVVSTGVTGALVVGADVGGDPLAAVPPSLVHAALASASSSTDVATENLRDMRRTSASGSRKDNVRHFA